MPTSRRAKASVLLEEISTTQEVLNPYKLLVAVLIREYVRLRRELVADPTIPKPVVVKEKEREDCKNYLVRYGVEVDKLILSARECFDILRIIQHLARSPERDLLSTVNLLRHVIIKPLFLLFRRVLEIFRKDDHEETCKYIENNFTPVLQSLKGDNAIGALFLRNVRLLFDEMSFSAYERFNTHLLEYINSGFRFIDDLFSEYPTFVKKAETAENMSVSTSITYQQSEHVLAKEANLLLTNPLLASDHFVEKICSNISPPHETGEYLRFLNSIRMKNYDQAVEALHKYFILKSLSDDKKWQNSDNGGGLQPGDASLQLCLMHHNAGHHDLAVRALKECIFLAQEKGDMQLLGGAMYWLACLEINNNQYEKLFRGARGGDSASFPATTAQFATLIARFDSLFGASFIKVIRELDYVESVESSLSIDTIIQQYASRASFWKLYGFEELAVVYSQACVQIFPLPEISKFSIITDAVVLSAAILLEQAIRHGDEGTLEVLFDYCHDMFPTDRYNEWQIWGFVELVWKYQRAFSEQRYHTCELIVEQMSKMNPAEASLRRIELLYTKDCKPKKALDLLNAMLTASENTNAHVTHLQAVSTRMKLRLLLLKAEILLKTDCGLDALKCLTEALVLTAKHPNELWKAKVQLHLGFVWLHLDEPGQAACALKACLPMLTGCGSTFDQARVGYLRAKLIWSRRSKSQNDKVATESLLNAFEKALESFYLCSSVEHMLSSLYMMATICDTTGSISQRDSFSTLFQNLLEKFPHVSVPSIDV